MAHRLLAYTTISVLKSEAIEVFILFLVEPLLLLGRSVRATIALGRLVRATITLYPIGRPVRATVTLYPIGRLVRATVILYPIGRPTNYIVSYKETC